mmetsp:Transcript_87412/g.145747  ORF Transcript_87412/g.145747 Transcript_87412/m.145747 type:complete len:118 (-) Transcript_87412:1186-1539(-)
MPPLLDKGRRSGLGEKLKSKLRMVSCSGSTFQGLRGGDDRVLQCSGRALQLVQASHPSVRDTLPSQLWRGRRQRLIRLHMRTFWGLVWQRHGVRVDHRGVVWIHTQGRGRPLRDADL